jgi:hypothetical protein
VVFVESRLFTRRLRELAGETAERVLFAIQTDLLVNPCRGRMVRGLGGIRKERTPHLARGKGKRGGFRYLYLYLARRAHIHLLHIFDKDEQEDLSSAERSILRKAVGEIKAT